MEWTRLDMKHITIQRKPGRDAGWSSNMLNGRDHWLAFSSPSCIWPWVSRTHSRPPFETPDETAHYSFMRHLALGYPLPNMRYEANGPWSVEGAQAPLYYSVMGRLVAGLDMTIRRDIHTNPLANWGNPLFPGNKNYNVYSSRRLPFQGVLITVFVARWLSLLLSVGTIWLVYTIGRLVFPGAPFLAVLRNEN